MFDLSQLISRVMQDTDDFNELEERLFKILLEVGRIILQAVLGSMDARLMRKRADGLRSLGARERTVITRFGAVKIKRRYYRDAQGRGRFLLDEALGWGSGLAMTDPLEARALKMCSESSFRQAADNLSFFLSERVTHTILHDLVQRRGAEVAGEQEALAEELFCQGVLPPTEGRTAERLFMEADGCVISLQREERSRHELKAGISYEGWEKAGRGKEGEKFRLAGKRSFLSAAPAADFLAQWSAELASVYDYRAIKETVWSSDGASWLAHGPGLFAVTAAQLDRFHLARSIKRALGFSQEASDLVGMARSGAAEEVVAALEGHLVRAQDPGRRKRILQAISYLKGCSGRLADWRLTLDPRPGDRSLGAMESNVDKLVADRFKKRGMSWSVQGSGHMCKVIELAKNGELQGWCRERRAADEKTQSVAIKEVRKEVKRDPEAWCQAHMPYLTAKSGDPWVKDILRVIAGLAVSA